jgi:sulfur carrier protein
MIVSINGDARELPDGATVASALEVHGAPAARGVAVAVGAVVVPRGEWGGRRLADGDRLEIVMATQGG